MKKIKILISNLGILFTFEFLNKVIEFNLFYFFPQKQTILMKRNKFSFQHKNAHNKAIEIKLNHIEYSKKRKGKK